MRNHKIYLLALLIFVPPFLILIAETNAFGLAIAPTDLILPAVSIYIGLGIFLLIYLITPSRDFLKAINRAIHGDNRARFSCRDENDNFHRLSLSFNQLMSIVEKQELELSANHQLQTQLYENEKIYRSALELTCERVFEVDLTHNRLIYGQQSYYGSFPFLNTEIYSEIVTQIRENAVYEEDREKYYHAFCREHLLELFQADEINEVNLEFRQKKENNEVYWLEATIVHLSDNDGGDSINAIGYIKNIDQRKRTELEILKQSQKDGLTGLYNKKVTQSLIESYLLYEGNNGHHALIMLDVDNFKGVNDTLGHLQGDAALVKISERLQKLFRSSDVVGRIGGDEFFILMKNYTSEIQLAEKLAHLCDMFQSIHLGEDGSHRVSGSVGVSLYPADGSTYTELYKKADISLYYAKGHGKNCYYIYNSSFGNESGLRHIALPDQGTFGQDYIPREKPIDTVKPLDKSTLKQLQ